MVGPLIVRWSIDSGLRPLTVIFTFFKCVFIVMSTPTMTPCMIVPFFNSITTDSLLSRIRNLTSFIFFSSLCPCLCLPCLVPV